MLLTIVYGKVTNIKYMHVSVLNTVQQIYTLVQRHLPGKCRRENRSNC